MTASRFHAQSRSPRSRKAPKSHLGFLELHPKQAVTRFSKLFFETIVTALGSRPDVTECHSRRWNDGMRAESNTASYGDRCGYSSSTISWRISGSSRAEKSGDWADSTQISDHSRFCPRAAAFPQGARSQPRSQQGGTTEPTPLSHSVRHGYPRYNDPDYPLTPRPGTFDGSGTSGAATTGAAGARPSA